LNAAAGLLCVGRGQALYTTLGYGASGVIGGLAGGAISERGFSAVLAA
jgi:MFS transporter, PPP family, 3-phenylpropionic acid transporter